MGKRRGLGGVEGLGWKTGCGGVTSYSGGFDVGFDEALGFNKE